MEDTVEVITIEMNGNEYFLVDSVKFKNDTYHFFCNINNNEEIQVMKDEKDGEEIFYVSVDDENEYDKAFSLYYEKIKNENQ